MSFAKDCATSRRDPQVLSTFEQAGGLYGSDLCYVSGTSSQPLLGMTIGEAFDDAVSAVERADGAGRSPSGHPLDLRRTCGSGRYLRGRAFVLRAASRAIGSASGHPIARNGSIAQFATAKAGLILVNINPAYRPAELEYVLRKVGAVR